MIHSLSLGKAETNTIAIGDTDIADGADTVIVHEKARSTWEDDVI